jgi:hypothetical protein
LISGQKLLFEWLYIQGKIEILDKDETIYACGRIVRDKGDGWMDANKVISSICYFSIFFAGFILPIAVYFIADDHVVKGHAKTALLSHLIPLITIPIFVFSAITLNSSNHFVFLLILLIALTGLLNLGIIIYNIVKGIKVLLEN